MVCTYVECFRHGHYSVFAAFGVPAQINVKIGQNPRFVPVSRYSGQIEGEIGPCSNHSQLNTYQIGTFVWKNQISQRRNLVHFHHLRSSVSDV